MRSRLPLSIVLALSATTAARAGEVRADPDRWIFAWDLDPLVLLNLTALALLYAMGLRSMRARAAPKRVVRPHQALAFFGSLLLVGFALLSPLDALAADLFSVHMTQHVLLVAAAAPLFIWGAPSYVLAWAVPRRQWQWLVAEPWLRRRLWNPVLAWLLYAVVLWGWHHPRLYQAALRDAIVHDAQHLTLFVSALLFWRVAIDPLAHQRRLHPLLSVLYLFTTTLHATVLGVFIALAPTAWYGDYAGTTQRWGLAPLEDQQLAGLIMWVPSCSLYLALAAAVFGTWLARCGDADRRPRALARS